MTRRAAGGRQPLPFFGAGGALAGVLPGYEERPAQRQLAEAVERVFDRGGLLLAEAGTGTGKTLAYLLPAARSGRRVVITTGTKNLQEQLLLKDIPVLSRALGRELSVALMKGRGNYLCTVRFRSFAAAGTFRRLDEVPLFRAVEQWARRTRTGDRGEIAELPDGVDFWREIAASRENCIGQACPEIGDCWVTRMRQGAAEADLVIVNHHLLCADLALRDAHDFGAVLPDYDTLVIDEAHLLEDVATSYFGVQVSNHRVEDLARDAERELTAARLDAMDARAQIVSLRHRAESTFRALSPLAGRRLGADGLAPRPREEATALVGRLESLRAALLAVPDRPESVSTVAARAADLASEMAFLMAAEDAAHVYFVETRGRGVYLRSNPIDVAPRLRQALFAPLRAGVLTSATLSVDGRFDYLRARLGIAEADELLLASPFAYPEQAVLYVPPHMPEPQAPGFVERATDEIAGLLDISRGRAFVLFTSYANMGAVGERLAGRVEWPLLMQGEAPRSVLLDSFRNTPGAVLLATSSFWQGVDVAGEQLSCVIIDKLPFASPADPVVSARIEHLRRDGGNPFAEYQVPVAVLALKQGLGRLIRTSSDRGILAVLDSRLLARSYGRRFLESLPPARLVHDRAEVEAFFGAPA